MIGRLMKVTGNHPLQLSLSLLPLHFRSVMEKQLLEEVFDNLEVNNEYKHRSR